MVGEQSPGDSIDISRFLRQGSLPIGNFYLAVSTYSFFPIPGKTEWRIPVPMSKELSAMGMVPHFDDDEQKLMSFLFPDCGIQDCRWSHETGHPDFIVRKAGEELYVELKIGKDEIRQSQIDWIFSHPEKQSIILRVDPSAKRVYAEPEESMDDFFSRVILGDKP